MDCRRDFEYPSHEYLCFTLSIYIYFSLSVGYMSLCVPFTCGFQFTISIHCHLLLVCWLGTGQVQAIIFDLDGTLIDFEGGPNPLILNRELVSSREGWLGGGLVSHLIYACVFTIWIDKIHGINAAVMLGCGR